MSIPISAPAAYVPQTAIAFADPEGAVGVSGQSPLPISEPSFAGVAPITPDTPIAAPRAIAIVAQGAGDVALRFADASMIVFPVEAGLSILPFAAIEVVGSGTNVPATFFALA
ncbi:hypothetical protein SAMN05518801_10466 [Novosphingobium sp. CF614]|uniref:hypothetical protein n=1 Tax=Novosphingobium sp. CF614 TaxID=1884364 RepID=UPI0008EC07A9|nr:hypothetical protein [Novosphingobium sp. CF614]SFF94731.1 hypothetical protein SAMN05518801_10466 [Novosphingobium sp. CF614]